MNQIDVGDACCCAKSDAIIRLIGVSFHSEAWNVKARLAVNGFKRMPRYPALLSGSKVASWGQQIEAIQSSGEGSQVGARFTVNFSNSIRGKIREFFW